MFNMCAEHEMECIGLKCSENGECFVCVATKAQAQHIKELEEALDGYATQEREGNVEPLEALKGLMCWTMRDGSPCCCPTGVDEPDGRLKMGTVHSTACEEARTAIAKAGG